MEQLKSNTVTNLDATPIIVSTAGEGLQGTMKVNSDTIAPTSAIAQFATYRLCRFPTDSKVKHVWCYTSGLEGQTTATASLDINVAFSDSTTDGTPSVLVGTIPSNKHDGTSLSYQGTTGYSTGYTNSGTGNKLFGSALLQGTAGVVKYQEVTFLNTTASAGFFPANREDNLWNVFGFTNSQGVAQDPGGAFDIFVVVAAALTTAAAGIIGVEVDFVA
jgi:hypothetical protein